MKRTYIFLASVIAGVASCSAVASAHPDGHTLAGTGRQAGKQGGLASAHTARAASVQLRHTSLGTILTTASGLTLYVFSRDHKNQNSCVKVKECAAAWPALQTSAKPTAGRGVRASLLSSTRLSGGVKQVTYAGHPLYLFGGDQPGDTAYVGIQQFGGTWAAINATGKVVK